MKPLEISVVIPAYNMEKTIGETIASVLGQTYSNFEIIVQDNDSKDRTAEIVKSFSDPRIKYFKNKENLGYAKNLIAGWKNCSGEILYFLGADDILSMYALEETAMAFMENEEIGAIIRPYFWFQGDINTPIRVTPIPDNKNDNLVYIENFERAAYVMHNEILGQLSGLAFRLKYLKDSFFTKENDWIAHGYPFVNIFKNHPVKILKGYPVAIRIGANAIRQRGSNLYEISPTRRWISMLNETLNEEKYRKFKTHFIKKVITTNFLGLIQIKCYSNLSFLLREIWELLSNNWSNIFRLKFWFFSLGCILIPRMLLIKLVDWYKNSINICLLEKINFKYNIEKR